MDEEAEEERVCSLEEELLMAATAASTTEASNDSTVQPAEAQLAVLSQLVSRLASLAPQGATPLASELASLASTPLMPTRAQRLEVLVRAIEEAATAVDGLYTLDWLAHRLAACTGVRSTQPTSSDALQRMQNAVQQIESCHAILASRSERVDHSA